jgi:thiamine biosynthesis lipoprotein
MKQTRLVMGMPVTVEVVDPGAGAALMDAVFAYFTSIDERFSTYKELSEISLLNRNELALEDASADMKTVLTLAEQVRQKTNGYFDIRRPDGRDPSGLVKGWAIFNAAELIRQAGFENYYVDAGGDIQAAGLNSRGHAWRVGIRNPFNLDQIVKVIGISNCGVATSGTYIRGQHIYNPFRPGEALTDVVSLTVIGPDIYNADCYATAAFAMGRAGVKFVASLNGYEAYMIDRDRQATFTSGFARYVINDQDS